MKLEEYKDHYRGVSREEILKDTYTNYIGLNEVCRDYQRVVLELEEYKRLIKKHWLLRFILRVR